MPDVQIHPIGVVSAPGDYRVPDTAELLLKNAYAKFDGSGAAGSYLPLLRIISDAGTTLVEAVSDTTIAPGGSCDASWFPRVGAAAAAAGFAASWITCFDVSITVPTGLTTTHYDFTAATTYTNDGTTFTIDSTNGLKLNATGWYQVSAILQWQVAAPAAQYAEMLWNCPNVGRRTSWSAFADDGGVAAKATTYQVFGFPMDSTTVGSHGKLDLRQFSGASATCSLSFSVVRLTADSGNF